MLLSFAALAILLFSRPAAAALLFAPMCGPHAQTVVAPPISRAAPEIPLAPSKCNERGDTVSLDTRNGDAPAPPAPPLELTPRLPPLNYRLPPAPCLLVRVEQRTEGERAAHRGTIERPPR